MAKAPKLPKKTAAAKSVALGSEAKALAASGMTAQTISTVLLANIPLSEIKSAGAKIKYLEKAATKIKKLNKSIDFATNRKMFEAVGSIAKAIAPLSKISYTDLLKANSKIGLLAKIIPNMKLFVKGIGNNQKVVTDALLNTTKAAIALSKMSKKDIKAAIRNKARISPLEQVPTFAADIPTGASGKTSAEKLEGKRSKITLENISRQIFENNTLLKEIKMMLGLKKGGKVASMVSVVKAKGKGLLNFLMPFLKKLLFSPLLLAGAAFLAFGSMFWKRIVKIGATSIQAGASAFKLIGSGIWRTVEGLGTGVIKAGRGVIGYFKTIGTGIWKRTNVLGKAGWFGTVGTGIWGKTATLGKSAGYFKTIGTGIWKFMSTIPGIRQILSAAPETTKLTKLGLVGAKGVMAATVRPSQKGRVATKTQPRIPIGKPGAGRFAPAKKIGRISQFVSKMKSSVLAGWVKALGKRVLKYIPFAGFAIGMTIAYMEYEKGNYVRATLAAISAVIGTIPGPGTIISLLIDAGLILSDVIPRPKQKKIAIATKDWSKFLKIQRAIEQKTGQKTIGGSTFDEISDMMKVGISPRAQQWKSLREQASKAKVSMQFQHGGEVPGYPGQPRSIIAHAREFVMPAEPGQYTTSIIDQITTKLYEMDVGRPRPPATAREGISLIAPNYIKQDGDIITNVTNLIPDHQQGKMEYMNRVLATA